METQELISDFVLNKYVTNKNELYETRIDQIKELHNTTFYKNVKACNRYAFVTGEQKKEYLYTNYKPIITATNFTPHEEKREEVRKHTLEGYGIINDSHFLQIGINLGDNVSVFKDKTFGVIWEETKIQDFCEHIPVSALLKYQEVLKENIFDYFNIASIKTIILGKQSSVKEFILHGIETIDPVLFGRINNCDKSFYIDHWGNDIDIHNLKEVGERANVGKN